MSVTLAQQLSLQKKKQDKSAKILSWRDVVHMLTLYQEEQRGNTYSTASAAMQDTAHVELQSVISDVHDNHSVVSEDHRRRSGSDESKFDAYSNLQSDVPTPVKDETPQKKGFKWSTPVNLKSMRNKVQQASSKMTQASNKVMQDLTSTGKKLSRVSSDVKVEKVVSLFMYLFNS